MDIVIRAFCAFVLVFVITRLGGRRQLGSLEPFDLILLVVIGDLIQQVLAVSYVGFRFPRAQPLIDPQPMIVVQDGEPIVANLRKERMTVDELLAEARQQQIPSLEDVQWAVLESNGRVSFIKKTR